MKLNRLGAFTLGVVITAVSVGAVSFATASGGSTITACANKSTGAMRLLAKGSCKKTENKVTWNKQGIQGIPGTPSVNGATTSEISAEGNVYDSSGKYIGQLVGVLDGGYYDNYKIARGGVYFDIGSDGGIHGEIYFDGPNCTGTPHIGGGSRQWPRPLSRSEAVLTLAPGTQTVRWYRPNSGSLTMLTTASVMTDFLQTDEGDGWFDQMDGVGSCTNISGYSPSLKRTVELITPPVDFTINSPLRMTANN